MYMRSLLFRIQKKTLLLKLGISFHARFLSVISKVSLERHFQLNEMNSFD